MVDKSIFQPFQSGFDVSTYPLVDIHPHDNTISSTPGWPVIKQTELDRFSNLERNGRALAESDVFLKAGEQSGSMYVGVKNSLDSRLHESIEGSFVRKMWDLPRDEQDDLRQDMKDYYMQAFHGMESYSGGAMSGIYDKYSGDDLEKAKYGLAYVNCASCASIVESAKYMNDTYHFMDEKDWKQIDSLNIYGVDNLSQHERGTILQPTNAPSVGYELELQADALVREEDVYMRMVHLGDSIDQSKEQFGFEEEFGRWEREHSALDAVGADPQANSLPSVSIRDQRMDSLQPISAKDYSKDDVAGFIVSAGLSDMGKPKINLPNMDTSDKVDDRGKQAEDLFGHIGGTAGVGVYFGKDVDLEK